MSAVKSRIAPTPSGFLHLGNALNFLLTQKLVKEAGGILRLRIDDLDAPRTRPEYIIDIFETLQWLGIQWEEGPHSPQEHTAKYSQHLRLSRYSEMLEALVQTGYVFACTCSRKEFLEQGGCQCREQHIPLSRLNTAWRIYTGEAVITFRDRIEGKQTISISDCLPDFIIRRRDGLPAYQVATLVDDLDFGVNLIVRGTDLLTSTAAQLYLAQLLGNNSFQDTTFYHHPLLKDDHGGKLSKSIGSSSLAAMRAIGIPCERISTIFEDWSTQYIGRVV